MMNLAYAWLIIFQVSEGGALAIPMPDPQFCQEQAKQWNASHDIAHRGFASCVEGYRHNDATLLQGSVK